MIVMLGRLKLLRRRMMKKVISLLLKQWWRRRIQVKRIKQNYKRVKWQPRKDDIPRAKQGAKGNRSRS